MVFTAASLAKGLAQSSMKESLRMHVLILTFRCRNTHAICTLTDYLPPLTVSAGGLVFLFVECCHSALFIVCHLVRAMANKQTGSDGKSMPAMGGQPTLPDVGGERLSMSDYQTLTHLLERAGRESRLGEVLFYSGLTEKTQEQISQYDSKLKGKGPWVYEDGLLHLRLSQLRRKVKMFWQLWDWQRQFLAALLLVLCKCPHCR